MPNNYTYPMSVKELQSLFHYDLDTGLLYWKAAGKGRSKSKPAGNQHRLGYMRVFVNGRFYYSHRIIWALHHGSWPEHEIDHINGDPTDNRIENLRAATRAQNCKNIGGNKANTSGAKGVYYHKEGAKWAAQIKIDRRKIHLGLFEKFDDAVAARKVAEDKYFGEWKRGTTCV